MCIVIKSGLNPCVSSPFCPLTSFPSYSLFLFQFRLFNHSCYWVVFFAVHADMFVMATLLGPYTPSSLDDVGRNGAKDLLVPDYSCFSDYPPP